MQGQAQGTWPALQVEGDLTAHALRYQQHRFQELKLTYAGTSLGEQPQVTAQLLVQQAQLGPLPWERLTLEARYQGAERQAHFTLEAAQTAETGGKARGTVHFGATAQELVLEELLVQLPKRPWRLQAPGHITFTPQQIRITPLHLTHAAESISLAGAVAGAHFQDVQLRLSQLDLSSLQQLLQLPQAVAGRASAEVQLAGTLAQPQIRSTLTLQAPPAQSWPFVKMHATLAYAAQRVQGAVQLLQNAGEVLTLDYQLPLDLAFTDLSLAQRLQEAPLAVRLTLARPDLTALRQVHPALPALTGTLQGTVRLQGTYAALAVEAEAHLQQLGLPGIVTGLEGPLHLRGAVVTATSVPALRAALTREPLRPRLERLVLRAPTLRGRLPAQATGEAASAFQVHDLLLEAAAQWTPQGLYATLQRLQLHTRSFGLPRTEMHLATQWTPQGLEVSQLQVHGPQSVLRAQGALTLPEQRLQLRVDVSPLRLDELPLTLPAHWPPVVQGVISVRGSLQAPQVEASLQYADGQVRTMLEAQLQGPQPRYTLHLQLAGLDLAQLLSQAQGRLQAEARLRGTGVTGDARQASLEMRLETAGFNLAPGLTARLQARLRGDTLDIRQLALRSTPATFLAHGTLSATQTTALDYRLTLGDLQPLGHALGLALHARGEMRGQVQGTRGVLQAQGTLQLDDWRVEAWQGQRLHLDLRAQQLLGAPQGALQAQVHALQGPSLLPTSLRLDTAYTASRSTFTLAVTQGPYAQSRMAGILFLAEPAWRLLVSTLRLQHHALRWENATPIAIVQQPQGPIQVQPLVLRSGSQTMRVSGSVAPGSDGALDVSIQGAAVDLALLAALSPAVTRSAGTLDVDLHVGGTVQQPQLRGTLSVRGGVLHLAATGVRYDDIQVHLRLAEHVVEVARFQVGSPTGPLQMTGQIAYRDLQVQRLNLVLQAQRFTALHTPGLSAVLSAEVRGSGDRGAWRIDGTLTVLRARLVLSKLPGSGPKVVEPWELTVSGVYGRRPPDTAPTAALAPAQIGTGGPLAALSADLKIDLPRNVWVQGSGTALELGGELRVTKESQEPSIVSGSLATLRGFASFYGTKFELTQGQVTFTGSSELNPHLDVTLTRQVSDYAVTVHAGGKALQPEITLASTPTLGQTDIISLLVLGKTTDRLTSQEQGALGQEAQTLAGSVVLGQLEGTVGELLGLDTIELTTKSARVGRYISQDLYLSYERDAEGKEISNTVGVEYSLSPRLKLQASGSDTGESALDLLWRLDY